MLSSINYLLPDHAKPYLKWDFRTPVQFHLAKNRITKWGFFKPSIHGKPHMISLNEDLNPHAFLFTLIHEIAHLICWEKYGNSVRPHGKEWQGIFGDELFKLFKKDIFPSDLVKPIWSTISKPRASCNANQDLIKAFSFYDATSEFVFVDTLEINSQFETQNGKRFIKGEKLRKRYKCQEIITKRWYVFSPIAKVKLV